MYQTQHAILTNFIKAYLASYSDEKARIFDELYKPNLDKNPIHECNKFWRMQFSEIDIDTREIRESLLDDYELNDYFTFLTSYLFHRIRELDLPVTWLARSLPYIGDR